MATSYDPTARGAQSTRETGTAARRVADELLLASCAIAESGELLGIERRLRQAALRFVQAGPSAAPAAAALCLTELARELGMESAYLAFQARRGGPLSAIVTVGADEGVSHFDGASELLAGLGRAAEAGLTLEYPGTDSASASPGIAAELEQRGIRSLRWLAWPTPRGETILVGVHSRRVQSYWSAPRRQLHDGLAELMRSALPWIRRRRSRPRPAQAAAGTTTP